MKSTKLKRTQTRYSQRLRKVAQQKAKELKQFAKLKSVSLGSRGAYKKTTGKSISISMININIINNKIKNVLLVGNRATLIPVIADELAENVL